MKYLKILIFCTFIICTNLTLKSQCMGDETYTDIFYTHEYKPGDVGKADINYKRKIFGTSVNIIIDWSTLNIQNNILLTEKIVKFNVENAIIKHNAALFFASNPSLSSVDINVFFSKNCKSGIRIIFELERNAELACCNFLDFDENLIEDFNTGSEIKKTFKQYKSMPCGTKCCLKSYTVNKVWNPIYSRFDYNWGSPTISTYSECTSNPIYLDCITGQPRPCTGDCND